MSSGLGSETLKLLKEIYGGRESRSGPSVTVKTALEVATVLAVVRVVAFGVAQVPFKLHREREGGRGSDPADDHPLYWVLYRRPNPWMTSFTFRVTMMFHLLLCGNFFALKNRVRGEIVELIPIEPGRVEVKQEKDYSYRYWVTNLDGQRVEVPAEMIWHVRGPSWNSWMGLEGVRLAREAIGLTIAIEDSQANLHKDGLRPSGLYAVEGTLTPQQYPDLRKFILDTQAGGKGDGGFLLMDRSAKFTPTMMTGVDAQTLESRKLQIEEICRAFGVMPVMVGHPSDMAARAAMEQMFIAHVVHCLMPWGVSIEQSVDVDLLDPEKDKGVYVRFNFSGLMRGDMKAQAEWFAKALGQGATGKNQAWATPNDVRDLLEWNPIDGGDELSQPQEPAGSSAQAEPVE